ncbi:MAG: agmatine deiminase family protein [Gemmatimonadota bacterium]|nr:MAG: agmatine deiminase family protein [Gemmatimonadota bacterium]
MFACHPNRAIMGLVALCVLCGSGDMLTGSPDGSKAQDAHSCDFSRAQIPPWSKKMTTEERTAPSADIRIYESKRLPSSPVRTPAEFEPCRGVIIYWDLEYEQDLEGMFLPLIRNMDPTNIIYIGLERETDRVSVRRKIARTGCSMDNIKFLVYPCSPFWMRDFGPFFVYDSSHDLAVINTGYRLYLPQADDFPRFFSLEFGYECYDTGYELDGGHFITDGRGLVAVTDHFYCLNPSLSRAQGDSLMAAYFGCDRLLVFETCQESGHFLHIDVFAKFLNATTVLVSQSEDTTIVEYNLLESFASVFDTLKAWTGTPFDVVRVPWNYYYTYINSLILDNQVFLPVYQQPADSQAIAAYQSVLPDHEIVPINCQYFFNQFGGAIHCLTREVPEAIPTSGVKVTSGPDTGSAAGEDVPVTFTIHNEGLVSDTYDIEIQDDEGWNLNFRSSELTLASGTDTTLSVRVTIPDTAVEGSINEVMLTATSQIDPSVRGTNSVSVTVCEKNKGDVNTDCALNVLDVVWIVNSILELRELSPNEMWRADCNGPLGTCDGDGGVDVLDALKIVNVILGLDACL